MNNKEYIQRMVIYWDPWGLINNNSAPEDEYDSYVEKIEKVAELNSKQEIEKAIREIFTQEGMPSQNLERAITGMVEGIIFSKQINN